MSVDFTGIMGALTEVVGEPDSLDSSTVPYWLPTSIPNINIALSGSRHNGMPGGRLITIAGPESSGKTALATELVVQGQKQGGIGFLMDFEHAFHHPHAKGLGVDYGRFYAKRPDSAEEGFSDVYKVLRTIRAKELGITLPENNAKNPTAAADFLRAHLRKRGGVPDLRPIVGIMDSIASMIPRAQDIEYTSQNMKTKNLELAAMLSIELKRLARDASNYASTIVLLNQIRLNPGVMFGDPTTEPGGNAPKFYASVQLRIRRVAKLYAEWENNKSPVIGDIVEMFVQKNKCFRPFQRTRYVFRTVDPIGLDPVLTMVYLGKEAGVIGPKTGTTIDSTTFLGAAGSKRHSIAEFETLARTDPAVLLAITDHVLAMTSAVEEVAPAGLAGSTPSDDDDLAAMFS